MGRRQRAARGSSPEPSVADDGELDLDAFSRSMEPAGLAIRDVSNDGNCFFRAVSDQLYGTEELHMKLRERACDYLAAHEADYRFFVDEEQSFDEYVAEMRTDGVWADNLELQAISMACNVNIRVHQSGKPSYDIRNHPSKTAQVIHLSYHFGEHYASVRPLRTALMDVPAQHDPLPATLAEVPEASHSEREVSNGRPKQRDAVRENSVDAVWKRAERGHKDLSALVEKTRKAVRAIRTEESASENASQKRDIARRLGADMKEARAKLKEVQDAIMDGRSAHRFRSKKIMHERHDGTSVSGDASDSDATSYSEDDGEEEELYKKAVRRKTDMIFRRLNDIENVVISTLEDVKSVSSERGAESGGLSRSTRGSKKKEQEAKRREKKERRRREQERMARGEPVLRYSPHSGRARDFDIAI